MKCNHGWTAIDDSTDGRTMTFAVGSNTIDMTKGGHDGVDGMRRDASSTTRQGLGLGVKCDAVTLV